MTPYVRVAAALVACLLSAFGAGCGSATLDEVPAGVWGETTLVEELALGVEVGADEYMFGYIASIAVGSDGTMYVSDRQQNVVRMYDVDGTYVRDIGRRGQGPGEYASAPALGMLPDGALVMEDGSTSRISFFSREGEYLDSFPIGPSSGIVVEREGNILTWRFEGGGEMARYSRSGEDVGRVEIPPRNQAGAATFVLAFGEGDIYPFPTETQSAWSPLGYVVTGRNDAYDIELRKPEGTIHLRRDIERAPMNREEQAEWEAFRQTLVERVRSQGRDTEFEPIPDVKPYFRQIHAGEDGRIWVFRYVAAEKRHDIEPVPERPDRPLLTWREPWTYDVFEPDGTFLGAVVVPETLRPHLFRGEHIWGALTDENDVEQVVRLRVVPEVGN
jgi:hypothetical protein